MITVALPKPTLGVDVIEYFKESSRFAVSDTVRWHSITYDGTDGVFTGDRYVADVGVVATPLYLRQPNKIVRRLFGSKRGTWEARHFEGGAYETEVRLQPVRSIVEYRSVELSVRHTVWVDPMGAGMHIVADPNHPAFAEQLPAFEQLMQTFLEHVQ